MCAKSPNTAPHVTIIRPVKGLEPYLYDCLASTFKQDYPANRLTVHFCIFTREDAAYQIVEQVLRDHSSFDARIFVEEEDPTLIRDPDVLGPNPKIRNMSRSYRHAKGDILWILDCNVWVGRSACGRMVDKLCGLDNDNPYKFVHQLPIVVDVDGSDASEEVQGLLHGQSGIADRALRTPKSTDTVPLVSQIGGGRLDEMFMGTSHAKFYTAINTVAVAPCICGKSNMFRRSHLNLLTSKVSRERGYYASSNPVLDSVTESGVGIDYFSNNICEDHLIADLLWKSTVPFADPMKQHGLVWGELAVQPVANMSVKAYIARRVRWLRVRKFTVTLATLVEPGTESFLCSFYGAFGLTTLPWAHQTFGIPQNWMAFWLLWLMSISIWAFVDFNLSALLHSGRSIRASDSSALPPFVRKLSSYHKRPLRAWITAWLGREALAFPVWAWAFYGGVSVTWRDRHFWVGTDMKVHEIKTAASKLSVISTHGSPTGSDKARQD